MESAENTSTKGRRGRKTKTAQNVLDGSKEDKEEEEEEKENELEAKETAIESKKAVTSTRSSRRNTATAASSAANIDVEKQSSPENAKKSNISDDKKTESPQSYSLRQK